MLKEHPDKRIVVANDHGGYRDARRAYAQTIAVEARCTGAEHNQHGPESEAPGWEPTETAIVLGDEDEIRTADQRADASAQQAGGEPSATLRLTERCEEALQRQGLGQRRAAREASLPADAFRNLRRGDRPSLDRADEICRALGITLTLGRRSTAVGD